ncbi:hypothetical protein [Kineococcus sp. SYSU DK001]|uniref:hypothetical protein n=1 Tax=Kineococcus sp. SYSU DK001 TaxID=3383122 RepID=UPI003D7E7CAB
MLDYPDVESRLQLIRMMRRAAPVASAVLVVEGVADQRALFPFLASDVTVLPVGGKNHVLDIFESLRQQNFPGVLCLVDCDGDIASRLKGQEGLILSVRRDMDADLLVELEAYERVILESVADKVASPGEGRRVARQIVELAEEVATTFGMVLRAAQKRKLPVKLLDLEMTVKRRVELRDVDLLVDWLSGSSAIPSVDVASRMGTVLHWPEDRIEYVIRDLEQLEDVECKKHFDISCRDCRGRAHANGHSLIEGICIALRAQYKVQMDRKDLERRVRLAVDPLALSRWEVWRRMSFWQASFKYSLLAGLSARMESNEE